MNSDTIEDLVHSAVDWYARNDTDGATGWVTTCNGHIALLTRNQATGYRVVFRGDTRALCALPPSWKLLGQYPAATQSLDERSQALAVQLLAAIDSKTATPVTRALAAWDLHPSYAGCLRQFAVGLGGAHLLEHRLVPPALRGAAIDELATRGVAVGWTYFGGPATWFLGDAHYAGVWSTTGQKLIGSAVALILGFRTVGRCNINAVQTFVDTDDPGHRGVKLLLSDQSEVVVIEHHDRVANDDSARNQSTVVSDGAWASELGQDLAAWLDVPHQDELG